MITSRRGFAIAFFILITALSPGASYSVSTQSAPRIDFTIGIADASKHLFHLTGQVTNAPNRTMDISLPSWTPGWYTIRPYAANVMRLEAKANGKRLALRAIDKQTYRIETEGNSSFTFEYDYFANNLSVNGAELTEKRGYFMGTNLFFYVPGRTTDTPSTVKFDIPAEWRVATGLKPAGEKNVFIARNFDNLVDCPTVIGDFDEFTTTALGKTIHIIVDPKGQVSAENAEKLKDIVSRTLESQGKMFGGLPYEEYWALYVTGRGGGALEHENSTNIMLPSMPSDPRSIAGVTSHEHFHVWNVKRIKPAGLIPYDYSKEQYIRELWFAEGVTNYYGDLHLRRAGLLTVEDYLRGLSYKIRGLQNSEPRLWISLSDASITTWLTYGGGGGAFANFTNNYYNKGELVGLLLDLEIRGATANKKSLDDVMRAMFEDLYKRDRGYTNEDIEMIASDLTGKSFKEFFNRYVNGTVELDYNFSLKRAGLKLDAERISDLENVTEAQRALRRGWLGE